MHTLTVLVKLGLQGLKIFIKWVNKGCGSHFCRILILYYSINMMILALYSVLMVSMLSGGHNTAYTWTLRQI